MPEYTDQDIPISCGECAEVIEGVTPMEQHVLTTHPAYIPTEVAAYVRSWADSAYDQIDAENAYRAEYFREHGEDPFEPRSDQDYGNER